jgi:glycosyltransferase involved in cell wall biosynthesis
MRIGLVFHKNPLAPPTSIDLVRLRALARGFLQQGLQVEIISPVAQEGRLEEIIPVRPLEILARGNRYDLLKTCYHPSIRLIDNYRGPVVCRLVRVVDEHLPERDESSRKELLECQDLIQSRASALVFNNQENLQRWRQLYGGGIPALIVPTGCPARIPPPGRNPYKKNLPIILFLGSLAAPRMVEILNELATRLQGKIDIHWVGRNKAAMYGGSPHQRLNPRLVEHGEIQDKEIWDYIRHADIGLALATGTHPFDNDISKILYYLRGGLPVLSEEPIINNDLILETGWGKIFGYDDLDDLVDKATQILAGRCSGNREGVMQYMAAQHSWERRVETYLEFFRFRGIISR